MNERPEFISPPVDALQASEALQANLKKGLEDLIKLGGSDADIQAHQTALDALRKSDVSLRESGEAKTP